MKYSLENKFSNYRVTMPKAEFLEARLNEGYDFKLIGEKITFVTGKSTIRRLLSSYPDITFVRRFHHFVKTRILAKAVSVFFLGIILVLFASSSYLIREISFKNEEDYDDAVYQYVYEHMKKVGPFYFFEGGLNELSEELRETFINYAWVGLERRGGKIIIDIERQEVEGHDPEDPSIVGSLMASKDGFIKGYLIERGVNLITINQSVKKGQLLVSGNLKYHNGTETQWIRAKGLVLSDTVEYVIKVIPKEIVTIEYSGSVVKRYVLSLVGKDLATHKNTYAMSDIEDHDIFNMGFLKLHREFIKEKNIIRTVYNQDDATRLSQSMIEKEFRKDHKHPKEKITGIELVSLTEGDEDFVFTYLVKKTENIAIFIRNG
jgi:similar to stage IV sporulation protein